MLTTPPTSKVRIQANQFLRLQLEEFQRSGRFFEQFTLVTTEGFPGCLREVITLVELLRMRSGAHEDLEILISKAVASQSSWLSTNGEQPELCWDLEFVRVEQQKRVNLTRQATLFLKPVVAMGYAQSA